MLTPEIMRGHSPLRRVLLATLATLLASVAIAYGSLWMYSVRSGPRVELGFNKVHGVAYDVKTHSQGVADVAEGSPAERAGLRPGDRIIGVNGRPLNSDIGSDEAYLRGRPGDPVQITVERAGEPTPLTLHGVFRTPAQAQSEGLAATSARQVMELFPIPFLLVAFAVLFLRLEEPNAWLLALLFCGFIAAPDLVNRVAMTPSLRTFVLTYRAIFSGMLCPLFYLFFAVFPQRSPLERRLPWLKWAGLLFGVSIALPALETGGPSFPGFVVQLLGGDRNANFVLHVLSYALVGLGMISLAQNSFIAAVPAEARRKSRVMLWGTLAGVLPIVIGRAAADLAGYRPSAWLDAGLALVLFLYPCRSPMRW